MRRNFFEYLFEKPVDTAEIATIIWRKILTAGPVCPCGLIGHSRTRRVIGGTLADIEAYPYAVSI